LLVLRAVASIIQSVYSLVTGQFTFRGMGVWEPWFYLGATLFANNLRQHYWREGLHERFGRSHQGT
jgi:hypothetical protein